MKYLKYILISIFVVSCSVQEVTGPRLEVTIISPEINPTTAQALIISNQKFIYEAKVLGADSSTFEWKVDNEVISNQLKSDSITYKEEGQHVARFSTSNESYEAFAEIIVNVVSRVATFNDLLLETDSYWIGNDSTGEASTFTTGGIDFLNNSPTIENDYYNFGYSNLTDSVNEAIFNKYGAYILVPSPNQFGIARLDSAQEDLKITFDSLYTPTSIALANNPLVMKQARGDFGLDSAFTSGDYYDIEIRGINNDGSITDAFASLRMFEKTSTSFNSVKEWTSVDLTSLGIVKGIQFKVNTTAKDQDGILTIEKRFCLDNLILINDANNFVTP